MPWLICLAGTGLPEATAFQRLRQTWPTIHVRATDRPPSGGYDTTLAEAKYWPAPSRFSTNGEYMVTGFGSSSTTKKKVLDATLIDQVVVGLEEPVVSRYQEVS